MDALSDLLRVVRLSSGVFLDAEFSAPWCVNSQVTPEECAMAMATPARVVGFHYVLSGSMLLQRGSDAPVELRDGHIVLLPRNDLHVLASAAGLQPGELQLQLDPGGIARIRHGGGGATTHLVCGFVGTDAEHHPLIDALPPVLMLDVNNRPSAEWVASSFRYAAREFAESRPGAAVMLSRLSELLFVEAMRSYIESLPADRAGWLAGLRDPVVGRALALLHTRIGEPWTAEALANAVHLSRSAFAERFTSLVGVPPMRYLNNWRMQVAAQRLRESTGPVARIAAEVGYESEFAFAKAFKRAFSETPARWRRRGAGAAD